MTDPNDPKDPNDVHLPWQLPMPEEKVVKSAFLLSRERQREAVEARRNALRGEAGKNIPGSDTLDAEKGFWR